MINKYFGKPIAVKVPVYQGYSPWLGHGEFGFISKNPIASTKQYQLNQTTNCREYFAKSWGRVAKNSRYITLSVKKSSSINVAKFVKKLEDTLGLKNDRTVCHRNAISLKNKDVLMIIEPSKWWLTSAMRRSVFTIFLRAGKNYDGKNFEKAIYSQKYFRWTKNAVEQFLEGNTYYRGNNGGWVNVFRHADELKVKQRLFPENKETKPRPKIPIFGKKIKIDFYPHVYWEKTGNYAPLVYSGGLYKAKHWSYCREKMNKRKWSLIIFCHKKIPGNYIADFLRRIERKLKLPKYSKCGPTNRNYIMWIKVSPFWRSTNMRKSFFTALLRASRVYNPNIIGTYTKALTKTEYFISTKHAVKLFLQGYTEWNGKKSFSGWVKEFSNKKPQTIKKMIKRSDLNER